MDFLHFEEFGIGTEIIDRLSEYAGNIDRVERSDMVLLLESSILWTIDLLHNILERIEWCIGKKREGIGIIGDTIHCLESLDM